VRARSLASPTPRPSATRILDGVVVALLLLALAVAGAVLFLTSLGILDPAVFVANDAARGLLFGWIAGQPPWVQLVTAGVSAFVSLVALAALGARVRRTSTGTTAEDGTSLHLLTSDERGFVYVARGGIEGVARAGASSTPGVAEVEAKVRGRGPRAVGLTLRVKAMPGAALDDVAEMARARAVSAVEELAGFDVRDASVRVDVIPPDRLAEGVIS